MARNRGNRSSINRGLTMTKAEKSIEKASKTARKLKAEYNASVVWMGGNKFIIVKDGTETVIEA